MVQSQINEGKAFGVVSVTECVKAAMRDLGHEWRTYGPALHERMGLFVTMLGKYFYFTLK